MINTGSGDIAAYLGCPDRQWSLASRGKCGIKAFGRPCQRLSEAEARRRSFPDNPVCASERELVFIVEDDEELRTDLSEIVRGMGYEVVGCANFADFIENIESADTGCVIVDIRLPGSDGLAVLENLEQSGSALPAVMLSGMQDPQVAAHCMKHGAVDYLLKPANEIALGRAIGNAIAVSRSRFCEKQSKTLVQSLVSELTPSELKIAQLLAEGHTTKLVSGILGRSENTVKIHRHRVMQKLNISTVANLANIINSLD
jgi:FixJ family two-component response regulator